jgi:hypothetical protein
MRRQAGSSHEEEDSPLQIKALEQRYYDTTNFIAMSVNVPIRNRKPRIGGEFGHEHRGGVDYHSRTRRSRLRSSALADCLAKPA